MDGGGGGAPASTGGPPPPAQLAPGADACGCAHPVFPSQRRPAARLWGRARVRAPGCADPGRPGCFSPPRPPTFFPPCTLRPPPPAPPDARCSPGRPHRGLCSQTAATGRFRWTDSVRGCYGPGLPRDAGCAVPSSAAVDLLASGPGPVRRGRRWRHRLSAGHGFCSRSCVSGVEAQDFCQGCPSRRGARIAGRTKRRIAPNCEALINIPNRQIWYKSMNYLLI